MATPAYTINGTSDVSAATLNRAVISDGTKTDVKSWHARIRYNGSSNVVESSIDSAGFTTGAVAFDATDTEFDITLSGFTNPPVILLTSFGATAYEVKVIGVTNVLANIGFFDIDTGAKIATGTEDTDMDLMIWAIGE